MGNRRQSQHRPGHAPAQQQVQPAVRRLQGVAQRHLPAPHEHPVLFRHDQRSLRQHRQGREQGHRIVGQLRQLVERLVVERHGELFVQPQQSPGGRQHCGLSLAENHRQQGRPTVRTHRAGTFRKHGRDRRIPRTGRRHTPGRHPLQGYQRRRQDRRIRQGSHRLGKRSRDHLRLRILRGLEKPLAVGHVPGRGPCRRDAQRRRRTAFRTGIEPRQPVE